MRKAPPRGRGTFINHLHRVCTSGDPVAIAMPMTVDSVEIYLGIVLAGCVVVSMWGWFHGVQIGWNPLSCRLVRQFTHFSHSHDSEPIASLPRRWSPDWPSLTPRWSSLKIMSWGAGSLFPCTIGWLKLKPRWLWFFLHRGTG